MSTQQILALLITFLQERGEEILESFSPPNLDAGDWAVYRYPAKEGSIGIKLYKLESQIVARNLASELNRIEVISTKGELRHYFDVVELAHFDQEGDELAAPKEQSQ